MRHTVLVRVWRDGRLVHRQYIRRGMATRNLAALLWAAMSGGHYLWDQDAGSVQYVAMTDVLGRQVQVPVRATAQCQAGQGLAYNAACQASLRQGAVLWVGSGQQTPTRDVHALAAPYGYAPLIFSGPQPDGWVMATSFMTNQDVCISEAGILWAANVRTGAAPETAYFLLTYDVLNTFCMRAGLDVMEVYNKFTLP